VRREGGDDGRDNHDQHGIKAQDEAHDDDDDPQQGPQVDVSGHRRFSKLFELFLDHSTIFIRLNDHSTELFNNPTRIIKSNMHAKI